MIAAPRQALLSTEISAVTHRSQCLAVIKNIVNAFGLSHGTLFVAPTPADVHAAPLVLESTLPIEFIQEYDRHQMVRHCPMITKFADSIRPHTWDLMASSHDGDDLEWLPLTRDLMLRFGLIVGVFFVFNAQDHRKYYMRFEGDRPPISRGELNELNMIAMELFDRYNSLLRAEMSTINALSARELEVLRWTAQGKTSVEIGSILTLSDHTINAYMNTAMKKLDCVNRTQLVAKAIRLKLIQ
ncbi:DNA-binding CsgD family transcriptional regulator [Agrobacterium vitis]|uniref:LuxR family transcriptional regulator n=1 Tax=Allorhizobium terrae TaxID=1848972 RepID=A0A4S4A5E8_9HYPH|nr:LuxR family transcriptional regulator [Allorhizobium terrae]TWD54318.1 DNA-binding CsgD family transcriptional regulator [Agrobacterium vitis]